MVFSFLYRTVQDTASYTASLIGVFAMGLFRHVLSRLRLEFRLANRAASARGIGVGLLNAEEDVSKDARGGLALSHWSHAYLRSPVIAASPALRALCSGALVYALTLLGFLNMLVAMTYNPGLLAALVAGETLGAVWLEADVAGLAGSAAAAEAHC